MSDDDDSRACARKARRLERLQQEAGRKKRLGVQNTQSDQERIRTRQDFRKLIDKTKKAKGAVIAGNQQLLKELHKDHDVLHGNVFFPSEANLDVEELSLLATLTAEKTKKMAENFTSFSADEYADKIKSLFSSQIDMEDDDDVAGSRNIDWTMLGMHPLSRILSVRTADSIPNVMEVEIVAVKKKQSTRAVREVDTQAETVQALQSTEKLVKTQTENRVQMLLRILERLEEDPDYPLGVPLMRLVVNPDSFSQSVENLFDLSFLIGSGLASFTFDNSTEDIYVKVATAPQDHVGGKGDNVPPVQSIVTMTHLLWEESKEVYNISESIIPHRDKLLAI